jgi:hypothetical protein
MKTRGQFVSNSSSSSFLVYGIYEDFDTLRELVGGSHGDDQNEDDVYEQMYGLLRSHTEDTDLSYTVGEEEAWVGISYGDIKENETGKQFKQRVEAEMKKAFGKKVKCEKHEGIIYTG